MLDNARLLERKGTVALGEVRAALVGDPFGGPKIRKFADLEASVKRSKAKLGA